MKIGDKMKHKELFEAILALETLEDCELFFEDIATKKEIADFSERLNVAKLLLEGETYEAITKKTSISSATIARINRSVSYGSGGYKRILERIKKD